LLPPSFDVDEPPESAEAADFEVSPPPVLELDDESAFVPFVAAGSAGAELDLLPERMSVFEQPEPMKTEPTAKNTVRSGWLFPHAGQSVSGASLKLCTASSRSPHFVQTYS